MTSFDYRKLGTSDVRHYFFFCHATIMAIGNDGGRVLISLSDETGNRRVHPSLGRCDGCHGNDRSRHPLAEWAWSPLPYANGEKRSTRQSRCDPAADLFRGRAMNEL